MINIKDYVKVPSRALQLMVDGLERQSKRSDFEITMGTYGDVTSGLCFGCAATCTIQEIANKNLDRITISDVCLRAESLGFDVRELNDFEYAMDCVRRGYFKALFNFLDIAYNPFEYEYRYENRFILTDENWRQQLRHVKEVITELKAVGL